MRDIHQVLKQKEDDCARLRHEIEALRIVIPLVDEDSELTNQARSEPEAFLAQPNETSLERDDDARELQLSEAERKGPLSSSLRESSWWRKQGNR